MDKWECTKCGWLYWSRVGHPPSGIPAGTPFEQLPDDYLCPSCRSKKDSFKEIAEEQSILT